MRKKSAGKVVEDFKAQVDEYIAFYTNVRSLIEEEEDSTDQINKLAEQTFISIAVAVEGFFSDLIIAYINRAPARFREYIGHRAESSMTDKFGEPVWKKADLNLPTHPKVDFIRQAVDPEGYNFSASTYGGLLSDAKPWLSDKHYSLLESIPDVDRRILDTVKAIRNYVVHRSKAAQKPMDNRIETVGKGQPNHGLGRQKNKVRNVGSYLKAGCQGSSRLEVYGHRLSDIASKLEP